MFGFRTSTSISVHKIDFECKLKWPTAAYELSTEGFSVQCSTEELSSSKTTQVHVRAPSSCGALFLQQARAEQEEEFISNTLMKKIQDLKKEKETLAMNYEQEEEYLTNDLSRKLLQVVTGQQIPPLLHFQFVVHTSTCGRIAFFAREGVRSQLVVSVWNEHVKFAEVRRKKWGSLSTCQGKSKILLLPERRNRASHFACKVWDIPLW